MPSAHASYVKLVTPWGELHLEKDLLFKIAGTVAVLALTTVSYLLIGLWSKAKVKAGAQGQKSAAEVKRSALEENIVKKGEHSYYYAHQARSTSETKTSDHKKTMVSSYGWTDRKKSVDIYLTDDAVTDMTKEQLKLNWTPTSLSLDVVTDEEGKNTKSLVIPTLFNEISDVKWKVNNNQLTITLYKVDAVAWTSLNGAAKNLEDHIEYDDSLYD
ncbi:hypothetical protein Poli38472_001565 [Pythium oligandrum]|uniref:CS domain-containing protein n=1 Tax=Pythium oligandrum TaxID=41045 RepID=A0A8K1CUD2_PYTOL|nr:hypothetical protein Poli38472_001565 [Pythium oligandrum]|eukprot:TMW69409.1 hypothetical protein Poli38472_001565 [Pythium oligandrum]